MTTRTLRVSVVPGMVLPIKSSYGGTIPEPEPCIWMMPDRTFRLRHPDIQHESNWQPVTLPSAAAPGLWAVKLRVLS
jgi:hypothetical protein